MKSQYLTWALTVYVTRTVHVSSAYTHVHAVFSMQTCLSLLRFTDACTM